MYSTDSKKVHLICEMVEQCHNKDHLQSYCRNLWRQESAIKTADANRDKDEQKVTDSLTETRQRSEFSGSCQLFSHRDAGVVDQNKNKKH